MPMHAAEIEGKSFAAIDLGSNSFHMIVARVVAGELQVVDRLRDPVRMGAGLTADGGLLPEVRDRALNCLAQFGQRLRGVARGHFALRRLERTHGAAQVRAAWDALAHTRDAPFLAN